MRESLSGKRIIRDVDRLIHAWTPLNKIVEFRDHHFLNHLNPHSTVVDLGAHTGEFSRKISSAFGCRCMSVEANPNLYNGMAESPLIKKFNCAICGRNGPVRLYLSENPEATSLRKDISDVWGTEQSIEVPGIRFEDFIDKNRIEKINLLKVDIEGMETELFESTSDETFRRIDQMTVEFHGFCNPSLAKNIPGIKKRLRRLGFLCLPFPFHDSLALDCDTLFINKKLMVQKHQQQPGAGIALHALRLALYARILLVLLYGLRAKFRHIAGETWKALRPVSFDENLSSRRSR